MKLASVVAHHRRRGTVLTQNQEELLLMGAFALFSLCGSSPLMSFISKCKCSLAPFKAAFVAYRAFGQGGSNSIHDSYSNIFNRPYDGYAAGVAPPPSRSEPNEGFFGFGHRPRRQPPPPASQPQDPNMNSNSPHSAGVAGYDYRQRPPQRYQEPGAPPAPQRYGGGSQQAPSAQTQGIEFSGWACPGGREPCVFEEYTYY